MRTDGEAKSRAVIGLALSDLLDFFNTGNTMTPAQMANLTGVIVEEYNYLKIDDFKLCFSNAKKGLYGQVYRMDGNTILCFLEKYIQDRMNAADEDSYNKHMSEKANERRVQSFMEVLNGNKNEICFKK